MIRSHWLRCLVLAFCAPFVAGPVFGQGGIANGPTHAGRDVSCDLPIELRVTNTVGTNGMGLCVWASLEMTARYQNLTCLMGVFDQMKREPGGGWPERVDRVMKARCPEVLYRQHLGSDMNFIREGIDSGRMVCVTYGYGELYGMRTIAHWVVCVRMDDEWTAILDNNDIKHIWWMPTSEFARRFTWPRRSGWALYLLTPPPPPVPRNHK